MSKKTAHRWRDRPKGVPPNARTESRTFPAAKGALLAALYPVPKYWDTAEQREKYFHFDLEGFSPAELALEADKLKPRLLFEDERSIDYPWLLERWEALQAAQRAQKGRAYGRS